jgi:hypothetical protein
MAVWILIPDKLDEDDARLVQFGVFGTTLIAFFLAEMGDKTQIATIALAAQYGRLHVGGGGHHTRDDDRQRAGGVSWRSYGPPHTGESGARCRCCDLCGAWRGSPGSALGERFGF